MVLAYPETAVSVAGLTAYLQALVEEDCQLQQVWAIGEVSSLQERRGNLFFVLSEPDGSATLRCVVWRSQQLKLIAPPATGQQFLVLGSIRLYPKRGEYQLTVFQSIAAGEGLQALRYQQLRSRLAAEGLFAPERKRPLPGYPQIVAVVTSATAAAWGDIQRTIRQRAPGTHLLLSPALVQGEAAPTAIATAIERVNGDGRAEVIIVARGGGAVEDLACFNDERVVRAIVDSQIPIITGIGHQRDESLADLAADVCAHTPTAAAERAVPDYGQLQSDHQERVLHLQDSMARRLSVAKERLKNLQDRLKRLPTTAPRLQQAAAHCQLLEEKLAALDPHSILQRGYATVRQEQTLVRSTAGLAIGEELWIQLASGQLKVKITEIIEPFSPDAP